MTHRANLTSASLASVAVHFIILFAFTPSSSPTIPGIQEDALSVTLIVPHKSTPRPQRPTASESTLPGSAANPGDEIAQSSAVSARSTAPTAPNGELLDTPTHDPNSAIATAKMLETLIRKALIAHFHYPPLARQNGWHGEVRVGLHIEPNGELSHIHLLRSSGYGILDHAAIHSLTAVITLPNATALLSGDGYDLILPVQYLLLDS